MMNQSIIINATQQLSFRSTVALAPTLIEAGVVLNPATKLLA